MKNSDQATISQMQFLLKDLYIYYNYEKVVEETQEKYGPTYMRDKSVYRNRALFNLEKVFKGKTEKEIHALLLKAIAEEL